MPCNGDDNDADMAIFLHGRRRHELFSFKRCFFPLYTRNFLVTIKEHIKDPLSSPLLLTICTIAFAHL